MPYVPGETFMLYNMDVSAIVVQLPGNKKIHVNSGGCINLDSLDYRNFAHLNRILNPFERSGKIIITTIDRKPAYKQASPAVSEFDSKLAKLLDESKEPQLKRHRKRRSTGID